MMDYPKEMLKKKVYSNGRKAYALEGEILTCYYKNGKIKASGPFVGDKMEGEWRFYRETGQLRQIGNYVNNRKHGPFVRYNRNDQVEFQEIFENNKVVERR